MGVNHPPALLESTAPLPFFPVEGRKQRVGETCMHLTSRRRAFLQRDHHVAFLHDDLAVVAPLAKSVDESDERLASREILLWRAGGLHRLDFLYAQVPA